jgi:hypothetical protein
LIEDKFEDREWISELVLITINNLPKSKILLINKAKGLKLGIRSKVNKIKN